MQFAPTQRNFRNIYQLTHMHTYISLLRGINVSGQKIIKMDALRHMYEALGFEQVQSYLQSGNVIFQAAEINTLELAERITAQIANTFGFDVVVLVLTTETLREIIQNSPFAGDATKDNANCYVTYLERLSTSGAVESITSKALPEEKICFTDRAVYLYCPKGYGTSKLSNNLIESKLKVRATTRNWKTTVELMRMAGERGTD